MKKICLRIIVLVFVSLSFTDCATTAVSNDFSKYDANANGLIIGTVTFPKNVQWFDKYFFRVKELERNKSVEFTVNSYENVNDPAPDNDYTKKYIFIMEKKPGKYEIDNIRLFGINEEVEGHNAVSYFGRVEDFIIPMTVAKGEITYIGDIFCLEDLPNKRIYFKVTDTYDKDIRYFKKKNSSVNWSKVTKSIVQPQQVSRATLKKL